MRILTSILLATTLSTVAAAQPWRAPYQQPPQQPYQPQTEERYQPQNQLAEVRLEAGRGRAVIHLPRTGRAIDYLELRAGRTPITLVNVRVRLADGSVVESGDRGLVEPFEGRVIDLPHGSAQPVAVIARYRTAGRDYRGARLEVFGVREHQRWSRR